MVATYTFEPEKWNALYLNVFLAAIAGYSYVHGALAFHATKFFRRRDVYRPPLFQLETYMVVRVLAFLAIGFGYTFAWNEIWDAEHGNATLSGSIPTNTQSLVVSITFLLYLVFSSVFGITIYQIGIERGLLGIPLIAEVFAFAAVVLLTVWSWFIWWGAGLMVMLGAIFAFYSLIITIMFRAFLNVSLARDHYQNNF
jgi:hypothetical protein